MRLVCIVPPLPLSLLVFVFVPDLSAGREREKADEPLRRAFSHFVVKGKGAIAESPPSSIPYDETVQQPKEKEREREREGRRTGSGVGHRGAKNLGFFPSELQTNLPI